MPATNHLLMPFSSLGLSPTLLDAVRAQGFSTPTAVQQLAIPAALQSRDVLGCAQTGSGKTLAFVLPLLQHQQTARRESPRRASVLILVPTRELSVQVSDTIVKLAVGLTPPPKVSAVFGGVSINPQMMALRGGTDVVVATPGRLLDLLDHNALSLSGVRALVLDEADRLLDLGFSDELARILTLLPGQRQNLFFSATFAPAVQVLAESLLRDPVRVDVLPAPQSKPDITQRAIAVDPGRRTQLLRHLIQASKWSRVLVFVATKHAAEIVADKLRKAGIDAEPFHGLLSQGKRTQVLADFKAERVGVVVATDLAGRGIDIEQLPVVVNYDLPRSAVDYTHRIGRTGRAGESGVAVSFVSADTHAHWHLIEKRQGLKVPLENIQGFEPMPMPVPDSRAPSAEPERRPDPKGGIKGKRPNKKDKLRAAAKAPQ